MYPVLSQPAVRAFRAGDASLSSDSRPFVPDGADLPSRRMARDNSRAAAPQHLGLGANATLQVTPQLAQLLGLKSASVDLNHQPLSTAFGAVAAAAAPHAAAGTVMDPNIPASSRRYMKMPVFELLEEVVQRCVGEGPDEDVPTLNHAVWPEIRRLGDMAFALLYTPGREHDALILRNAGLALNSFFFDYRTIVESMRSKRPDLAPVLTEWRLDMARAAIANALAVPLGADGQPQYAPTLYDPVVGSVREPFESHIAQLEWRLGVFQRKAFVLHSRQFFLDVSVPIDRKALRENRVLGASTNELEGSDVRAFLAGTLTFRCSEADLPKYLAMVPAAELQRGSVIHNNWAQASALHQVFETIYPNRGSGTSIKYVQWQDEKGVTVPLIVANWKGVHSVSRDFGRHWLATGAATSEAFDDLRADGWRRLMADRWHAHKKAVMSIWTGGGGR